MLSVLLDPRALAATAALVGLGANLLLGADSGSAGFGISGGRQARTTPSRATRVRASLCRRHA